NDSVWRVCFVSLAPNRVQRYNFFLRYASFCAGKCRTRIKLREMNEEKTRHPRDDQKGKEEKGGEGVPKEESSEIK
ncbi:MAG: hypothetical protein II139_04565, partial [Lachnospiraceae bacterium]|nr:hypothetical protein [Lachnospiraceae bacterium]